MKQTIANILKLAIGVGLLYFLYTKLQNPAAVWQQIAGADKRLLLAGALCYTGAVALNGIKWGVLLRAGGIGVTLPRLLVYQWLAEFFNNFLPAQVGGDLMRGYALATDTRRAGRRGSQCVDRPLYRPVGLYVGGCVGFHHDVGFWTAQRHTI